MYSSICSKVEDYKTENKMHIDTEFTELETMATALISILSHTKSHGQELADLIIVC